MSQSQCERALGISPRATNDEGTHIPAIEIPIRALHIVSSKLHWCVRLLWIKRRTSSQLRPVRILQPRQKLVLVAVHRNQVAGQRGNSTTVGDHQDGIVIHSMYSRISSSMTGRARCAT